MFGNIKLHRAAVPREQTDIKPLTITPSLNNLTCTAPYREPKCHLQRSGLISELWILSTHFLLTSSTSSSWYKEKYTQRQPMSSLTARFS